MTVPYLPVFNLLARYWTGGFTPATGPPAAANIPSQLYLPTKGLLDIEYDTAWAWQPPLWLRLPSIEVVAAQQGYIWEIPQLSGLYYHKRWVDLAHQGFPNEYWQLLVAQCDDTGVEVTRWVV